MASTTLADYQVLTDGSFTLDASSSTREKTLSFTVPSDLAIESGSRQPVIAFKVRPDEDSTFKILMNNREVASFNLDKSHTRCYWEPISATTAFPNGSSFSNPVPVKFIVRSGRVLLSDVIVWYQIKR